MNMRKHPKDYVPVREQYGLVQNSEHDELERLKMQRQREEYEIMMYQKSNIELLKMQSDPLRYPTVHEHDYEDEEQEHEEEQITVIANSSLERQLEVAEISRTVETQENEDEPEIDKTIGTQKNDVSKGAVEINESDDESLSNDEAEHNDEEDKALAVDKPYFEKRSLSNKPEEAPCGVVILSDTTISPQKESKKKTKHIQKL